MLMSLKSLESLVETKTFFIMRQNLLQMKINKNLCVLRKMEHRGTSHKTNFNEFCASLMLQRIRREVSPKQFPPGADEIMRKLFTNFIFLHVISRKTVSN
jgi:hypothetical protein